jgi:hypothetical protein
MKREWFSAGPALMFVSVVLIAVSMTLLNATWELQSVKHKLTLAKQDVAMAKHVTELHRKECPQWGKDSELCVATTLWFQRAGKAD